MALLAALALLLPLAPAANARHAGPCVHEYVDHARYGAAHLQDGGIPYVVAGYKACVDGTLAHVCDGTPLPCTLP